MNYCILLLLLPIIIIFFNEILKKEGYNYPNSSQILKKNKKCGCCGACD